MALEMPNMKNSKNISLYKITLLIIISILIKNIYVCTLILIYLFFNNKYEALLYLIIIIFIYFITNNYPDFIPCGIIIQKKNKYYIVDKLLYKTKLYTNNNLNIGDIVRTYNSTRYFEELNVRNNYLFYSNEYKLIFNFKLKTFIYKYIDSFNVDVSSIIKKIIYFENSYDNVYLNLSTNLSVYIFIRNIKNKKIQSLIILIYSLLFTFNLKFLYILILNLVYLFDDYDYRYITILLIILINHNLIYNYSLIIPIVFSMLNKIDYKYDFKLILMLIDTFIFYEINIFYLLFNKLVISINLFFILFTFLLLLIPGLETIYLKIFNSYSYISSNSLVIRGRLTIIGILIYIILYKYIKKNNKLKNLTLLLILISPFNNPFMSIDFIDVGQGDSILIQYPLSQANILIDTGSAYNYSKLKKYLFSKGVYSIDYLIISHDDSDHNGNVNSLKNDFIVKNIIDKGKDIEYKNLCFKYYYLKHNNNNNDSSLVYSLNVNGLDFLFTGDISKNVEKQLINNYNLKDIEVLKVSHHGSITATSEYFVSHLNPIYAIISTSGQYNHPNKEVIETLNKYQVNTLITKTDKNIIFYITRWFKLLKYGNGSFVIIKM